MALYETNAFIQAPDEISINLLPSEPLPVSSLISLIDLHYNHHRYYDPQLGRYITSDPIGLKGGLNTYGYVDANPLIWHDMYGLTKGGKQNKRSSEFVGMSNEEVSAQARDKSIPKSERRKAQTEEKARKEGRNKQKRNKFLRKLLVFCGLGKVAEALYPSDKRACDIDNDRPEFCSDI